MASDVSSSQSSAGADFAQEIPSLVTSEHTHSASAKTLVKMMLRRNGATAASATSVTRSTSEPHGSDKPGMGGAMKKFISSGVLKLVASISHTRSVSHTGERSPGSSCVSVSVSSPESKADSTSGPMSKAAFRSLFRKKSSKLDTAVSLPADLNQNETDGMILCRHLSHETTSSGSGIHEPTPQLRASPLLSTTKPVTPLVMASVSHTEMAELERVVDVPLFPIQIAQEESVIFDDLTDFFSHIVGALSPTVLQRLLTSTARKIKKMGLKSPSKRKRSSRSRTSEVDTALVLPIFNPELWTVFAGLFDSLYRLLNDEIIGDCIRAIDHDDSEMFDEDGLCLSIGGTDVVTPGALPPGFGRMMTLPGMPVHSEAARLEDSLCVDSDYTEEKSEFWMLDDDEPEEKPEERWNTLCSGVLDLLIEELRQFGLGECSECFSVDWSVICDFAGSLVEACYEIDLDSSAGFTEHHAHSIKMFFYTVAMRAWIQHRDNHYNSQRGRPLPPPQTLASSAVSSTIEISEEVLCKEDFYAAAPPKPSAIKSECCRCSRRAMQAHLSWEKLIR